MMDLVLQIGLSNACIALLLAMLAVIVGKVTKQARLAHLIWLLVLIKLVTPPIVNIPVEFSSANADVSIANLPESDKPVLHASHFSSELLAGPANSLVSAQESAAPGFLSAINWIKPWFVKLWIAGSLLIAIFSLLRVARFNRLLNQTCQPAGKNEMQLAKRIGGQLGLKSTPVVSITSAQLCPMVWWVGGRVRVILPRSLFADLQQEQWQWVLAHELAHVRRRDYLVRWLEWLACTLFWWNPVVWWAQRNLRAKEELCCDELVLDRLKPSSHSYAESIVNTIELLMCPVVRPPAMASEINSGGVLERRIEMILSPQSRNRVSRRSLSAVAVLALLLIPLGIVNAQDLAAVKQRLLDAVKQDEISLKQAAIMMEALRGATETDEAEHRHDKAKVESYWRAVMEAEHALQSGKMTSEEGRAYLDALKQELWQQQRNWNWRHSQHQHDQGAHEHQQHSHDDGHSGHEMHEHADAYKRALIEAEHAILSGKMSHEQGRAYLDALKQEYFWQGEREWKKSHEHNHDKGQHDHQQHSHDDGHSGHGIHEHADPYKRALIEAEHAILSGKMSAEEARAYLKGLKLYQEGAHQHDETKPHGAHDRWWNRRHSDERADVLHNAILEVEYAVKAGKITLEEGHMQLEALKLELAKQRPDRTWQEDRKDERSHQMHQHYNEARSQLEAAVEAGKLSKEEAAKELKAIEHAIHAEHQALTDAEKMTDHWNAVLKEVEAAVESGKMTREEAARIYDKLHNQQAEEKRDQQTDADRAAAFKRDAILTEAIAQFEAAVTAGEMSEWEADQKLNELSRQFWHKKK